MNTHIIEVTNGFNWGKFLLSRFDDEWFVRSQVEPRESSVIGGRGWSKEHVFVMDLQTGEGAMFSPGGHASYDLNEKHKIWVCPMFEPFLNWLYEQDCSDIHALPTVVDLPDAESSMYGHRRTGEEW